jgi:hypothetical protein
MYGAVKAPGAGSFTVSPDLAASTSDIPQLAANAAGAAVAAWTEVAGVNSNRQVRTAYRAPGGAWVQGPLLTASTVLDAQSVQVGIDGAGNATAMWAQFATTGNPRVRVSSRPVATGTWSANTPLSNNANIANQASLAVNATGDAVAGRVESDRVDSFVVVATMTPAAVWPVPPAVGLGTSTSVALNDAGDAVSCSTSRPSRTSS